MGETEKNPGKLVVVAEHVNPLLFLGELDAPIGNRASVAAAYDRYVHEIKLVSCRA